MQERAGEFHPADPVNSNAGCTNIGSLSILLCTGCAEQVITRPDDNTFGLPVLTNSQRRQRAGCILAFDRHQAVAAALDAGYFSEQNLTALETRKIDAYIATGRTSHNTSWQAYFAEAGDPPPEGASLRERMAYKLRTTLGKAICRRRKCSVEPVFGQIKEAMGFRQFSLRGLCAAAGEWCLVCLAYNLRRKRRRL